MNRIEIISWLCFVFLPWRLLADSISWENCDSNSNSIKLLNIILDKNPVVIPGSVSANFTIHSEQDIVGPVKADVTLQKKVLFSYVTVPCVSDIGSCSYDDLCKLCSTCGCPLKAGDHALSVSVPIYIDSWALVGTYKIEIDVKTSSGETGCVKISNVHIQSNG